MLQIVWTVGILLLSVTSVLGADGPAELVLRGGTVLTCDDGNRQAEALAVCGGRVLAVGTNQEIAALTGPDTRIVELAGRTALPGFIEGHGHFLNLGQLRNNVDLTQAKSWREIVEMMQARAATAGPGDWIIGRGWHQEHWTEAPGPGGERYPTHHALSAVTPDHPVLLVHGTGHMAIANEAAMRAAGIDRTTANPVGGEILHDAHGEPTGVFRETARRPLSRAYQRWEDLRTPEELLAEKRNVFQLAARECLSKGITSFQDAGVPFSDLDFYQQLADAGEIPVRLWVMLSASPEELAARLDRSRRVGTSDGMLTVRAIKCMADGALGSHGALLLDPYDDLPESRGLRVQSLERIRQTALLAAAHDYQLCTHAIGDRANREVLDLYDEISRSHPGKVQRWRIEHVQHLNPADIPRFAEQGVIASMQANHATSDGPFVVTRLGTERARNGAYVWRSIVDAGGMIVNGTDAPVEDVDPLRCLYSAITRRMGNGETFFPEQCLTRLEALQSYTINGAYAAFEEQEKGSLEAGKLADIVVLSGNPLTIEAERFLDLRVEKTIVGGKIAFDRESNP